MSVRLKMIFVLMTLSVAGCGTFSVTFEPSLPPIDFCTTYPDDGIPTIVGNENVEASLKVDQLNAVYLEKCLGIDVDDLPDPDIAE